MREVAALSRRNVGSLLLRRSELVTIVNALKRLRDLPEWDEGSVLAGCFVRVKRQGQYRLELVTRLVLQGDDGGTPLLELQVGGPPIPGKAISDVNLFLDDAQYSTTGRVELLALQEAGSAAGRAASASTHVPPRLALAAAAGVAWRKKVLLAWGADMNNLMQQHGIRKLVADLADLRQLAAEAAYLDRVPSGPAPSSRTVHASNEHRHGQHQQRRHPALQQPQPVAQQGGQPEPTAAPQRDILSQCEQQQAQQTQRDSGPHRASPDWQPPPLPSPQQPPLQEQQQQQEHAFAPQPELELSPHMQHQDQGVPSYTRHQQLENLLHMQQQGHEQPRHAQDPRLQQQPTSLPCAVQQWQQGPGWPQEQHPHHPTQQQAGRGQQQMHQQPPQQGGSSLQPHPGHHSQPNSGTTPQHQRAAPAPPLCVQQEPPSQAPAVPDGKHGQPSSHVPEPRQSKQLREAPPPVVYSLLVANLGDTMAAPQLELYFRSRYPSVVSAAVPVFANTGEPKGIGFVRFGSDEERQKAFTEMDGHVLPGGRRIGTGLAGAGAPAAPDGAAQLSAATVAATATTAARPPAGSLPCAKPSHAAAKEPAPAEAAVVAPSAPELEESVAPAAAAAPAQVAQWHTSGKSSSSGHDKDKRSSPVSLRAAQGRWQEGGQAAAQGHAGARHAEPDVQQPQPALPVEPAFPPAVQMAAAQMQLQVQLQAQMLAGRQLIGAVRPGMVPGGAWPLFFVPPQGAMQMYSGGVPLVPRHPDPFHSMQQLGSRLVQHWGQAGGAGWQPGHGMGVGQFPSSCLQVPPPPPVGGAAPPAFHSGASSRDQHQPEAAQSGHSGAPAAPAQPAAAGSGARESGTRSKSDRRSHSPGRHSRGRSRSPGSRPRSSRSRSPGSRSCVGPRETWPRSRSRSPRRPSGARPLPPPGRASFPLWLPPMLHAACQACAFSRGLPFHVECLLPMLDDLRGQRDCLRGTGLSVRHISEFLHAQRWADVELRPDGLWVSHVRAG